MVIPPGFATGSCCFTPAKDRPCTSSAFNYKKKCVDQNLYYLMAEGPRKSSRLVKTRREAGFIYDGSVDFLQQQHSITSVSEEDSVFEGEDITNGKETPDSNDSVDWSDIYSVPLSNICNNNIGLVFDDSPLSPELGGSQSQLGRQNNQLIGEKGFVVDIQSDDSSAVGRLNSSTRQDFLDSKEPFLSVSSAVYTDTSELNSDMEVLCACNSGRLCKDCHCGLGSASAGPSGADAMAVKAMWAAIDKMENLTKEVNGLKLQMHEQNEVIKELKANSSRDSSSSEALSAKGKTKLGKSKAERTRDSSRSEALSAKGKTKLGKSKAERTKDEKERSLRLLKERLRDKDKESSESGADSEESDDNLSLKGLKKKMSKNKKRKCKKREAEILRKVGAMFPDKDFAATSSSGTDSDSVRYGCRHKKKVKSGASMSKRPVVRTEIWPHTIANEEDGEDVACDTISLAKFFSCYTYIMLECRKTEAQGRTSLLHAISLVLEALFWTEARTFHNLTMVKIEQGKLEWSDDFVALAESFIDKKVRSNMKSKSTAGYGATGKTSWYGKGNTGFIKKGGYGYSSNNKFSGRSKPVYSSVCKQWNFNTCTYGERCNRWHVCWTCAEAGKVGQTHKAVSHETTSVKPKQQEQRS